MLVLAMVVGMIPAIGFTAPQTVQAVSTDLVAMPSNNGLTNNTSYTIAVCGDINGDSVMSPLDASEILINILNDENYDGAKAAAENLDGSGWLTTTLVRRMLLEIAQAA